MVIPTPAKLILAFVRKIEVGDDGPAGYGVVYGHNQRRLPKPYTSYTVDEVINSGGSWTKSFGSSASGGYQFMRATLSDLKKELRLSGGEVMSPAFQDDLGYALLKRRGYDDFIARRISRSQFARRLAQEWASFPVVEPTQGPHRKLVRGQSFYTGDPLNKALVKPEAIEALLNQALVLSGRGSPGGTVSIDVNPGNVDYRQLQLVLKALGFNPGAVDGEWGPKTSAAVADFQRRVELPASGLLDDATRSALHFDTRRLVDPKRATDTEQDLASKGSETITLSQRGRLFGIFGMIAAALGFVGQQGAFDGATAAIDTAIDNSGMTSDTFLPLLMRLTASTFSGGGLWVAMAALAFLYYRNSGAIAERRLEDHRQGWNIRF